MSLSYSKDAQTCGYDCMMRRLDYIFVQLHVTALSPCPPFGNNIFEAAEIYLIACAHSARPLEDCHIGMLSNFVSHVLSAFAVVALGLKVFGKLWTPGCFTATVSGKTFMVLCQCG